MKAGQQTLYLAPEFREIFEQSGLASFGALWAQPRDFIDDVNERRGGWSAVSRLSLGAPERPEVFYLARQENQYRYSLDKPLGASTYRFAVRGIERNLALGLPAVTIAAYGFRHIGGQQQGMLVTHALESCSMEELHESGSDWAAMLPLLRKTGETLYKMHAHRISHGALYPKHLYINPVSGCINLLDFERSRVCWTTRQAIKRDLKQMLKRIPWLSPEAVEALLFRHLENYPTLTRQLIDKYYGT